MSEKVLRLTWQRLLTDGETCPRCQDTEAAVDQAAATLRRILAPHGVRVILEKIPLSQEDFARAPLESNRIWLNDRPLEDWVNLRVGQSPCCGPCGDAECRTLFSDTVIWEAIPESLIVQAGLAAASQWLTAAATSSCCPTPVASALAPASSSSPEKP